VEERVTGRRSGLPFPGRPAAVEAPQCWDLSRPTVRRRQTRTRPLPARTVALREEDLGGVVEDGAHLGPAHGSAPVVGWGSSWCRVMRVSRGVRSSSRPRAESSPPRRWGDPRAPGAGAGDNRSAARARCLVRRHYRAWWLAVEALPTHLVGFVVVGLRLRVPDHPAVRFRTGCEGRVMRATGGSTGAVPSSRPAHTDSWSSSVSVSPPRSE
jgi:hypothetical protein